LARGPLAIRVQYPPANARIAVSDSNFIYGGVGDGTATLTINGASVPVLPNGAFMAWLPVPRGAAPVYEIVATNAAGSVRLDHPIRLPGSGLSLMPPGTLAVDSASVTPNGRQSLRGDEGVRVSVRAPSDALVEVRLASGRVQRLVNLVQAHDGRAGEAPRESDNLWATDVAARELAQPATIEVRRGGEVVRLPTAAIVPADAGAPRYVWIGAGPATVPDTDRVVTARPIPLGTYKWLLLPGTVLETTGRVGDQVRVRFDSALEAWMNLGDVRALPEGTAAPRRVVHNPRVMPDSAWVDIVFPIASTPAYEVRVSGHTLSLVFYGVRSNADIVSLRGNDPFVRRILWRQESADRAVFDIELASAPYGWLPMARDGAFVLRVRRPPVVNEEEPLRGLTIAVNAGHPPAGATGPTGLYEGDAVLEVSRFVQTKLEAKGAKVVMTRVTRDPLALAIRPVMARRANAHAFVSIHLNALPDGVNPYRAQGTGSYWYHAPSESLARAMQHGLVAAMGRLNLGTFYDNLSDLRHPWMPSVLTEGAFIIMPEIEAALRTPEFQSRYATGIVAGLEEYFRELGAAVRRDMGAIRGDVSTDGEARRVP
jgi:N-acetylmuramoyl-L-alanine amidase